MGARTSLTDQTASTRQHCASRPGHGVVYSITIVIAERWNVGRHPSQHQRWIATGGAPKPEGLANETVAPDCRSSYPSIKVTYGPTRWMISPQHPETPEPTALSRVMTRFGWPGRTDPWSPAWTGHPLCRRSPAPCHLGAASRCASRRGAAARDQPWRCDGLGS